MKNIHFTILVIILLLFDFFSKKLAEIYLTEKIHILGNFIYLQTYHNDGIAFSIDVPSIILKILTIVLIFGIIYYYFFSGKEERSFLKDIGVACIIGGALGNAYERIFQGYVVDFIGVQYFSVFNLADTWITLGAGILVYYYFTHSK